MSETNEQKKQYWQYISTNGYRWKDHRQVIEYELRAVIALQIIQQNTVHVAAIPDGEDSAGRSKLRLQQATEMVQRAFEIAELYVDECEKRGALKITSTDGGKPED